MPDSLKGQIFALLCSLARPHVVLNLHFIDVQGARSHDRNSRLAPNRQGATFKVTLPGFSAGYDGTAYRLYHIAEHGCWHGNWQGWT